MVQVNNKFSWVFYWKRKQNPSNSVLSLILSRSLKTTPRIHFPGFLLPVVFKVVCLSRGWLLAVKTWHLLDLIIRTGFWNLFSVTEACQEMREKQPSIRSKLIVLAIILIFQLDSPNLIKRTFMDPSSLCFSEFEFLIWVISSD